MSRGLGDVYKRQVYTAMGAVNAHGVRPLLVGSWFIHMTAQARSRTRNPVALTTGFERQTKKSGMNSSDKRASTTSTVPGEENAKAQ